MKHIRLKTVNIPLFFNIFFTDKTFIRNVLKHKAARHKFTLKMCCVLDSINPKTQIRFIFIFQIFIQLKSMRYYK